MSLQSSRSLELASLGVLGDIVLVWLQIRCRLFPTLILDFTSTYQSRADALVFLFLLLLLFAIWVAPDAGLRFTRIPRTSIGTGAPPKAPISISGCDLPVTILKLWVCGWRRNGFRDLGSVPLWYAHFL
jgi:hypothetical protein